MINKILIIFSIGFIFCQDDIDSVKIKTDLSDENIAWKLNLFPLGSGIIPLGQFENDKPIKGLSIFLMRFYWLNEFKDADNLGNLSDRNRSFWWLLFLYFYGIIDAYVDPHIDNIPEVNDNEINNLE